MSNEVKYYEHVFVEGLEELGRKLDKIIELLEPKCLECQRPRNAHVPMSGHQFVK